MSRGGKRAGSGRKPEAGEKRSETARIPLTPGEKGELLDAAGDEDFATWAREILLVTARNLADRRRWFMRLGFEPSNSPVRPPRTTRKAKECSTCLGGGRIRDGETKDLRKCLDCNGSGVQ